MNFNLLRYWFQRTQEFYFLLAVFFIGFLFGCYFLADYVDSLPIVDCGNGYFVHIPLACPSL